MATEQSAARPHRGLAWARTQSNGVSLFAITLGVASMGVVLLGTLIVIVVEGVVPLHDIVAGFRSSELRVLLFLGMILGATACAVGWGSYRRMPTHVSREQCISGAVLGLQGLLVGGLIYYFTTGDVQKVAQNYLDFGPVGSQMGAFATGAKNTLLLAFLGEIFGIVIGIVLATLLISNRAAVRAPARAYVNVFRGTPLILQIAIIGIALPLGFNINLGTFLSAVIAFSLNTGAYSAEVFRAGIQSIERGQMEAARGLGMSYMQAMRFSILPQAVRRIVPPLMNEFVILIKDTSLITILPLLAENRDIFNVATQAVGNTFNATYFIFAGLAYLVVTLPLIRLVNFVERKVRSGLVGVTGV